jgi:hypothetical protein
MLQKFKIAFYAIIIGLVLVLPSQTIAESGYAESCKGWDCPYEGQVCPQGVPGASGGNYICKNSKWEPILAESCKGWDCNHDGQLCPQGADGASGGNFICLKSKWVSTKCTERKIMDLYNSCREIVVARGGAEAMHKCVGFLIRDDFNHHKGCDGY